MSKYGTKFQETEALLAVANDDEETVDRILDDMLPGELKRLAEDAENLAEKCWAAARRRCRDGDR
jgi:hypothetical protein